jgi:hypothetical protein
VNDAAHAVKPAPVLLCTCPVSRADQTQSTVRGGSSRKVCLYGEAKYTCPLVRIKAPYSAAVFLVAYPSCPNAGKKGPDDCHAGDFSSCTTRCELPYKNGPPRFASVPFKEYLSATRPNPRNELIPTSQIPSSQTAQPSPPITELVPQSNNPVASTRRDPPSNTPAKRIRLSEQVTPTPPPQGLLPVGRRPAFSRLNARLLQQTANSAHAASQ